MFYRFNYFLNSIFRHPWWRVIFALLVILGLWLVIIQTDSVDTNLSWLGKDQIAVLEVEGVLDSVDGYIAALEKELKNTSLKGLILKVNSPGGAINPCYRLYLELSRLAEKIPIYVSMGDVATSGGYMISLAGSKIFAYPSTITGSVGVISESFGVQELLSTLGIEPRVITSGKNKDVGSPFLMMTKQDKEYLEEILADLHQVFINLVLENRKLNSPDAALILDGRVFTGNQALNYGLIDQLADYKQVLEIMKEDLKIPDAKEYKIEIIAPDLIDQLSSVINQAGHVLNKVLYPLDILSFK